jgi:hypothetical protein
LTDISEGLLMAQSITFQCDDCAACRYCRMKKGTFREELISWAKDSRYVCPEYEEKRFHGLEGVRA